MEHLIYLTVKVLAAVYLLYILFRFLFGKNRRNIWNFLTPRCAGKEKSSNPAAEPEAMPYSIVGKSQTVYLEKPPEKKPLEPVFSEDLEKQLPYEEEPDIEADDVEYYSATEDILLEEERFLSLNAEPDEGEVSTGMTYEQISQALDVVQEKTTDDGNRLTTARILYEIQGSDVFDFLAAQAENEAMIEKLIRENIDDDGVPLSGNTRKQQRKIAEFDMNKYV
ncbi:hypothetical protein FACS189437_09890 [Bacteroidia bacterium]|nr:hypothetical protein FACS189437_09890 [Bacteroidia bacterium]